MRQMRQAVGASRWGAPSARRADTCRPGCVVSKLEAFGAALASNSDDTFCAYFLSAIGERLKNAPAERIDAINIRQATFEAMAGAVNGLAVRADFALIDGRDVPPLPCPAEALIGGDRRSLSIAAASIIAKVTRDRMMTLLAQTYPDYGFEKHMGYGTAKHLKALDLHGPIPLHRMSFAPLKHAETTTG